MKRVIPIVETSARFSSCRTWRYRLYRRWGNGDLVAFVLLNPSTADEDANDPTVRRCINYAQAWGYGGLLLGNLFAYRATFPQDMRASADPVGPENDDELIKIGCLANYSVVCGWGAGGDFKNRSTKVCGLLRRGGIALKCLDTTLSGEPSHPLYLRGNLTARPYMK